MKRYGITLFLILCTLTVTVPLTAQESAMKLYRIYVEEPSKVRAISAMGIDIYALKPEEYIEVLARPQDISLLQEQHYKVDFISNSFKELLEAQLGAELSEYHDYEATVAELAGINLTYPGITQLDTIGYSVQNRVIQVLKVSDHPELDEDEPPVLIVGCHHGNELLSVEAPLAFIHYLVDNYGHDPEITRWVDTMEICFVPLVNPDGREVPQRTNDHGVDLNRNYSFQFTPGGSHGPAGFSEPETRAIRDFTQLHPPILSLTYHTSGELVLYSWTHTDAVAPDCPILMQIGGTVADSIDYELRQGGRWYFTAGEYCDYLYAVHGAMAFTVEMYTSQTQPAGVIDQVMERNVPGFIALLKHASRSGFTGSITDATTGLPVAATLDISEVYDQGLLYPRTSDAQFGRYFRYLTPGIYTLTLSAPGYRTVTDVPISIVLDSLTIFNCAMEQSAHIVVDTYQLDDDMSGQSAGNDDGRVNINETIGLVLTLKNIHHINTQGVYAQISSENQYVRMIMDSLYFGDLGYNASSTSEDTALFYVDPSCPDGEMLQFDVLISDVQGIGWSETIEAEVYAPSLVIVQAIVHDESGNGNGVINNDETVALEVILGNDGRHPVSQVFGGLTTASPYVQIIDDTAEVSLIGIGEDGSLTFTVHLNTDAPPAHFMDFQLEITTAELFEFDSTFQLHNVNGLFDNFEGISTNWTHASWLTTTNAHDDWQWGRPQGKAGDPATAYSGEKCWGTDLGYDEYQGTSWNGYYQHDVCNFLRSPLFDCSGLINVRIRFRRWLNMSAGDEARVKVYNTVVWQSPATGIHDTQWTEQTIDISAYANDRGAVFIMFELESNSSGYAGGWNIDDVLVTGELVSEITADNSALTPAVFKLFDNYPNPFNPVTTIEFTLPSPQHIELIIFDALGREVKMLTSGYKPAGCCRVVWDGRNEEGGAVASGVYFYTLKSDDFAGVKKLLLLR